ncbi:MAG: hypothetical protein K2H52_03070, partial [Lachnospiraceae bacterium]|nr:hypothetical protein [Lachnospiraceae bacterium]
CESNAKALSTGYALSKVPLRPAGGFPALSQQRNIAMSITFATLQSSRTQFQDCKILIPCIVALLPCLSVTI